MIKKNLKKEKSTQIFVIYQKKVLKLLTISNID